VHLVGFLFIVVIADARNHEPEMFVVIRVDTFKPIFHGRILVCGDTVILG
jgi:hypothetical protein